MFRLRSVVAVPRALALAPQSFGAGAALPCVPALLSTVLSASSSSAASKKKAARLAPAKRASAKASRASRDQDEDEDEDVGQQKGGRGDFPSEEEIERRVIASARGRGNGNEAAAATEAPSSSSKAIATREQGDDVAEEAEMDEDPRAHLPNTLLVQLCDHMQHDQGVKRHAITITFGSDGFEVANLVREIRRDLKGLLATTYWQMNQTHERTAFFVCTRVSHGTADMLITSMTQRILSHVEEQFGYALQTSNVTLSPDVQHTSVRMLYQYFIFKKRDDVQFVGDDGDDADDDNAPEGKARGQHGAGGDDGDDVDPDEAVDNFDEKHRKGRPEFRNFEAPQVGPQEPAKPPKQVPPRQAVQKIWRDDE